jgi:hypothetical protein
VCVCVWRLVHSGIRTAAMSDVLHVFVICRRTPGEILIRDINR